MLLPAVQRRYVRFHDVHLLAALQFCSTTPPDRFSPTRCPRVTNTAVDVHRDEPEYGYWFIADELTAGRIEHAARHRDRHP